MNKLFTIICFLFFGLNVNAQKTTAPIFKNGDRVCFVGNSITHNGEFHHNILQYYITRFPQQKISFFNAGIKGDVTAGILNRLGKDVLIHKPTYVVLMIGMNDVQRQLYGKTITNNKDTLQQQKAALDVYNKNLDSILRMLINKKVKVILQKPSAYDQTSTINYPNNLGVNDALIQCGTIMEKLAQKHKLHILDYNSIMTSITKQLQEKKPNATLTVNDRVHPNSTGHFIMNYQFLKSMNATATVAKINIDVKKPNHKKEYKNCTIDNLYKKNDDLSFKVLENALPFPITTNQQEAITLVPFVQDFNNEILQIRNLEKGTYQVLIDSILIDNYSNAELQQGINIATNSKTPQYQQALEVRKALEQLWENEASYRAVRFVEYTILNTEEQKNNATIAKKYLDSLSATKFKGQAYYANAFEKYITYKPKLTQLLQQADSLRHKAYQKAKPITHQFTIRKIAAPTVASLIEASQSDAMPLLFDVQEKYLVKNIAVFNNDKEYTIRNGLPNFFGKINKPNANVTIGFLGGSITKAEDQYRNQTLAFIQTLNSNAKIKGVNAGVSGTGTELGACRVAEQIIQYNPDLVFVEFAVNGGSNEAMEGIVRQIKKHNSKIDICFIYTIAGEQYKMYAKNEAPEKIKAFDKVAEYYQIPAIHMGLYASLLEAEGKLIWKSAIEINDKIVFSKDGTHPTKEGGDLYAQAITRAFNVFKKNISVKEIELPKPLYENNWEDATMFSPTAIGRCSDDWNSINTIENSNLKNFAPWFTSISTTNIPYAYFTFNFEGTAFGFFDIGGPEVGQIEIEIDGKCATLTRKAGNVSNKIPTDSTIKCLINRFNSFCNNRYRGQFELFEVPQGKHNVKIILSNVKANKTAILQGQDVNDIQQHPEKYNQQVFYLGKILLKGKPIKP